MKKNSNIFTKLYILISLVYFCLMLIISLARYWPYKYWWLANLIQISPTWFFGLGVLFLVFIAIVINAKKILIIHTLSFFVILFFIMGYQIPLSFNIFNVDSSKRIKVATVDLGKTVNLEKVSAYIKFINPDIVAFQETFHIHKSFLEKLFPSTEWDLVYEHELALASRIPILSSELIDRRNVGSWGDVAAEFVLQGSPDPIYFCNIWLESPRKGLEAIMAKKFEGFEVMKKTTKSQETESFGVSKWLVGKTPLLVTGDFNHLASSPIHREHWSHLGNAFSDVGLGFGYTKYTSVHGVRLDHFLYSPEWKAIRARVGPNLEADHRPLQVDFVYSKGVLPRKKDQTIIKDSAEQKDNKSYFINENFNKSLGIFTSSDVKKLEIYRRSSFSPPTSLRIAIPTHLDEYSAGPNIDIWRIERFPQLSFAYRIPQGLPITVRVKTKFNQWVCIAKTSSAPCQELQGNPVPILIDDDDWHEFHVDVNQFIKSILSKIKLLKSIEFHFPYNRHTGEFILVDDFCIFKNE